MDQRLAQWVTWLDATGWPALVLDRENTLVWMSDEFKRFLRESDDERVGVGRHIVEAFTSPVWLRWTTPETVTELMTEVVPFFLSDMPDAKAALASKLDPSISTVLSSVAPKEQPDIWTGRFEYVAVPDAPPFLIKYLVARIREPSGRLLGSVMVSVLGLRTTLLALLARGDVGMYDRMSRLVRPSRQQTAILFADLQGSGDISRRMPTHHYFEVISRLTANFDTAVAANNGIVGKHAGDGWTAFYLVSDAGTPEGAAASALRTARALGEAATTLQQEDSRHPALCLNVGLHWGPNLYMGQLVPGGRLDVTALGDEVNECARIQETARDGAILASKAFMEVLSEATMHQLDIDEDALVYQPLGSFAAAGEKAVRDAATLAVCHL